MSTQLRHLNASTLDEVEKMLEALPINVEIKSISYAPLRTGGASEWIVHFCVDNWAPMDSSIKAVSKKKSSK